MSVNKHIDRNREHDITIDEVRSCSIFAHLTDAEALEVIETVKRFSTIMFHHYKHEKGKKMLGNC